MWSFIAELQTVGECLQWTGSLLETEHIADGERGRLFLGENLYFPSSSVLETASSLFWIGLPPLQRLSFSFPSFARPFCTELPHRCVSAKKNPVPLANGFPLSQTQETSNLVDFLQHFWGGFVLITGDILMNARERTSVFTKIFV